MSPVFCKLPAARRWLTLDILSEESVILTVRPDLSRPGVGGFVW
jgi:hypothetical protein